jgi:hypothetical protein
MVVDRLVGPAGSEADKKKAARERWDAPGRLVCVMIPAMTDFRA